MQKFLKKFQVHTPGPNLCRPDKAEMQIFYDGRHVVFTKNVNSFQTDAVILTTFRQLTSYSKQYGSLGQKCKFFKSKMAATAGPNSIDVIWHKKSAEDGYRTFSIVATIPYCNYSKRLSQVDRGTSGHR